MTGAASGTRGSAPRFGAEPLAVCLDTFLAICEDPIGRDRDWGASSGSSSGSLRLFDWGSNGWSGT